jgi:hypothetical protein
MIKSELLLYPNTFSLCILILPSYHDWKVFFINSDLYTPGTFIVPGSVQHTGVLMVSSHSHLVADTVGSPTPCNSALFVLDIPLVEAAECMSPE